MKVILIFEGIDNMYKQFDEMCWPVPGRKMEEIEYRLRHLASHQITQRDLLACASIISAYTELVKCSSKKRAYVVHKLKEKEDSE